MQRNMVVLQKSGTEYEEILNSPITIYRTLHTTCTWLNTLFVKGQE